MRVYTRLLISSLVFSLTALQPLGTLAQTYTIAQADLDAGFNPQLILDDSDLFDLQGMTLDRVREFVSTRGVLGTYRTKDIDGNEKSAAEIIWRVATSYKVNPKYLLALIQKEQSLVEDTRPSQKQFDWAAGYGVCDSCSMDDPRIQDFKGFANQLEWAAKQHREKYLFQILGRGTTISGYAPGKTTTVDGMSITPKNNATAMLYTYTPHIHGNLSLWRIWQRWFSVAFPEGTIVKAKTAGDLYLIRFGEKRKFKSRAVAFSMVDPAKILIVPDSQLTSYPMGKTISFPNYSLVQTETGKRYLIVGDKKRHILNMAAFVKFAFNEDEVLDGTAEDLASYGEGPDITTKTLLPTGQLAKDPTGTYWYIEDGIRHSIPHATFLKMYFQGRPAKALTQTKLETYVLGDPYKLHDGELVKAKGEPSVYVLENGMRRPISSGETFEQLGWKWQNVITLPGTVLADYSLGLPVLLQSPPLLASPDDQVTSIAVE